MSIIEQWITDLISADVRIRAHTLTQLYARLEQGGRITAAECKKDVLFKLMTGEDDAKFTPCVTSPISHTVSASAYAPYARSQLSTSCHALCINLFYNPPSPPSPPCRDVPSARHEPQNSSTDLTSHAPLHETAPRAIYSSGKYGI